MKELKYSLIYVTLFQILCWGVFIICDEFPFVSRINAELFAMGLGTVLLIVLLIVYFLFSRDIIKEKKLKSRRFNLLLVIFWIIFSISMTILTTYLVDKGILHNCYEDENTSWLTCFLNGIEYFYFGIELVLQAIILVIIKIIKLIIKKLKKK